MLNQTFQSVLITAGVGKFTVGDFRGLARGAIDVLHVGCDHFAVQRLRFGQGYDLAHVQRHTVVVRHRLGARSVIGLGQAGKRGAGEGGGDQQGAHVHERSPMQA